jgi:hypothetical protein
MFPEQLTVFSVTPLAREMIVCTQRWPHDNPVSKSEDAFYKAIFGMVQNHDFAPLQFNEQLDCLETG